MRKIYNLLAAIAMLALSGTGAYIAAQTPTSGKNWKMEKTFTNEAGSTFNTNIVYYDGFGRPVQNVAVKASGDHTKDIVQHIEYDNMGRSDTKTYLPFPSAANNNGAMIANPVAAQQQYYNAAFPGDTDLAYTFSTTQYDNLPVGTVSISRGPGKSSHEHPMQTNVRLNNANDQIKKFSVVDNWYILRFDSYYQPGKLIVQRIKQENLPEDQQSESYTYTNSAGQVVAKEVKVGNDRRITYYVYDDYGRKRFELPPTTNETLQTIGGIYDFVAIPALRNYCYFWAYDYHGRITEEWVPGADVVYTLYDNKSRVAMTQDGVQRSANQWTCYKYDKYDRLVIKATITGGDYWTHRNSLETQTTINTSFMPEAPNAGLIGYTNDVYPYISNWLSITNVYYYDNYMMPNPSDGPYYYGTHFMGVETPLNRDVVGMQTGSRVKLSGVDEFLTSVIYYDKKYNVVQTVQDHYNGIERVGNTYGFNGQVIGVHVDQYIGNNRFTYWKAHRYNSYGRLNHIEMQINDDVRTDAMSIISAYTYDNLGRVATKKIHNGAETTIHLYDLLGRKVEENSPNFINVLYFDKTPSVWTGLTDKRHDGKITYHIWSNATMESRNGYRYEYNPFGELTRSVFMRPSNLNQASIWIDIPQFNETMTYDRNGNVASVLRTGTSAAVMHNYSLAYSGNRLQTVRNLANNVTSAAYAYDANGNMTKDGFTGANITYDQDNMPRSVVAGSNRIDYLYAFDGRKLSATSAGSSTYYRGNFIYTKQGTAAEQLDMILFDGGFIKRAANGTYTYHYNKTDHLGNVRAVLQATGTNSLTRVQRTDYYPFGLAHEYQNTNLNRYLYNGKELQTQTMASSMWGGPGSGTFNVYDFGSRFYNPVLGRWSNIDPRLQFANPYLYAANNPAMFVDPDGEFAWLAPLLIAAAKGAGIAAASYTLSTAFSPGGFDNWNWGQFGKSVGFGALSGAATFGIGKGFHAAKNFAGEFGTAGIQGMAHAAVQGGLGALQGGNFWSGFATGAVSSWAALGYQYTGMAESFMGQNVFSAAVGGATAAATGGNFWQGAATGVIISALNHGATAIEDEILADLEMRKVAQETENGCLSAGSESAAAHYGIEISQESFRAGYPNPEEVYDIPGWKNFEERTGLTASGVRRGGFDETAVLNHMRGGNAVALNTVHERGGHTVMMNKVTRSTMTRSNGTTRTTYKYQVMDPDGGIYRNISAGDITGSHRAFFIHR